MGMRCCCGETVNAYRDQSKVKMGICYRPRRFCRLFCFFSPIHSCCWCPHFPLQRFLFIHLMRPYYWLLQSGHGQRGRCYYIRGGTHHRQHERIYVGHIYEFVELEPRDFLIFCLITQEIEFLAFLGNVLQNAQGCPFLVFFCLLFAFFPPFFFDCNK